MEATEDWNSATRMVAEGARRLNALDPSKYELLGEMVGDSYSRDDRRSLGASQTDGRGALESMQSLHDVGHGRPTFVFMGPVAEAGDTVSLVRIDTRYESGYVMESLHVVALDPAGLLRRQVLFDPEQRAEAEAEFERLAADQEI